MILRDVPYFNNLFFETERVPGIVAFLKIT